MFKEPVKVSIDSQFLKHVWI